MDVISLSSSDFYRLFGDPSEHTFSSGDIYEDESTGKYRAWIIVAYCSLLTVGLIGNIWVASVICCVLRTSNQNGTARGARAPRAIQIFILALCCADLIVLAFLLFLIADLIYGQWILPAYASLCRLYLATESLNKFCGPFLLVALSGYCYVSVCKRRLKSNSQFPLDSAMLCAIIIGTILVLVLSLITPVYIYGDVHFLIVHNSSAIYSITPKCAVQPPETVLTAFTIYSFIFGYVTPATLFTVFYASILQRVYKQTRTRSRSAASEDGNCGGNGAGAGRRYSARPRRRSYLSRTVKTSMGMVLFYLVCWTPYWTMCLRQFLTPHQNMSESNTGVVLGYIIHMLPYINSSGYPILYTVLNKAIKDAYRRTSIRRRHGDTAFLFPPGSRVEGGYSSQTKESRRFTAFTELASMTSEFASNYQLPNGTAA